MLKPIIAIAGIIVVILAVTFAFGCSAKNKTTPATDQQGSQMMEQKQSTEQPAAKTQLYACPMHPEQTSTDPNAKCPICGMKMEPVKEDTK